jgi:Replication-relaxation
MTAASATRDAGSAVSVRFGGVQVEMLECVYQHRLLSTGQLHVLYPRRALRRTQRALAAMERVGWLDAVRQPGGMKLWFVTQAGAEAVESIANRAELRRKVIAPEQAAGPLQAHTLAVNEVGVAFVRAARERAPDEFGPLAWHNEIAHPIGPRPGRRGVEMLIADAVLSYMRWAPDGRVCLDWAFVELDRATMALETLVAKLGRYVRLYEYAGPADRRRSGLGALWQEHYPDFPALLVVLANASRRRLGNRRWLVQSLWERDYAERGRWIDLRVCLYTDLLDQGPFAPIFIDGRHELVDWLGRSPDDPAEPTDDDEQESASGAEPPDEPSSAPADVDERDPWGRW